MVLRYSKANFHNTLSCFHPSDNVSLGFVNLDKSFFMFGFHLASSTHPLLFGVRSHVVLVYYSILFFAQIENPITKGTTNNHLGRTSATQGEFEK